MKHKRYQQSKLSWKAWDFIVSPATLHHTLSVWQVYTSSCLQLFRVNSCVNVESSTVIKCGHVNTYCDEYNNQEWSQWWGVGGAEIMCQSETSRLVYKGWYDACTFQFIDNKHKIDLLNYHEQITYTGYCKHKYKDASIFGLNYILGDIYFSLYRIVCHMPKI